MKTRSKLSILAFFSCCALTSMGFANWVISQEGPVTDSTTGGISADSVYMSNEYVYIKEADIVPFTYSSNGFVENGTTTKDYVGTMTATFTVDLEKCSEIANNGALSVTINLQLSNGESGLFDYTDVSDNVATTGGIIATLNEDSSANSAYITLSGITNTTGVATFTLTYTFEMKTLSNFQNNILGVFGENNSKKVEFIFSALINTNPNNN